MNGCIETFDSEAGYRNAIRLVIAGASRELRIFDPDLSAMGLEDRDSVELLDRFLAEQDNRRLQIALQDTAPLRTRMPRLLNLLRDHAHQVEVREVPEHLRQLKECWVLADQESGVVRFHSDHPRGKWVAADGREIRPWWQRADDLSLESQICLPWAVTGL